MVRSVILASLPPAARLVMAVLSVIKSQNFSVRFVIVL